MINLFDITPVEQYEDYFVKRDDLFCIAGVRGGKARTCWELSQGANGLVTSGSRQSPQANIVAHIANKLNIPCHVHTPLGKLSPELISAQAVGAEIIQHKAGYNNVIIARAREDALKLGWREIPFGMECSEAIHQTEKQVINIPSNINRIIIPVGSGMSLAGLLNELIIYNLEHIHVLGIQVGADPIKRLNKYAPIGWQTQCQIIKSDLDYHTKSEECYIDKNKSVLLDPIYEAKCLPFIQLNDLLWIVGIRQTIS